MSQLTKISISKHRWTLAWFCYVLLIFSFVFFVVEYNNESWFTTILQIYGLIIPIYPTILIFIQSRAASNRDLQAQLQHLQLLNQQKIDAMQKFFQEQIDTINNSANKQIAEFKNTTNLQIKTIQDTTQTQIEEQRSLTNKQIDALYSATQKQIENYATQTSVIVARLEDNSTLLAEILLRQLEDKLGELNTMLSNANNNFINLNTWQLLRTPEEKEAQLTRQKDYITRIEQTLSHFNNKWQQIKDFLNAKG